MSEGRIVGAEFADVSERDIVRLCKVGELYLSISEEADPPMPPILDDALRNARQAFNLARRIQMRRIESGDRSGNFSGRVPIFWPQSEILQVARQLDNDEDTELPLTFI